MRYYCWNMLVLFVGGGKASNSPIYFCFCTYLVRTVRRVTKEEGPSGGEGGGSGGKREGEAKAA